MKYYFFISKFFEKIDCDRIISLKSQIDLYGLSKEETSMSGTLCINILNNFNEILDILRHCIELTGNPFYTLINYLDKELIKINKNIADIIVHELHNYFLNELDKITKSKETVKKVKERLIEYKNLLKNDVLYNQYYDNLIKDFQEDKFDEVDIEIIESLKEEKNNKAQGRKEIRELIKECELELENAIKKERSQEELPKLIENYIKKIIEDITKYKHYFDLYFGILDNNLFNGKSLDFFQSTFSLEVEVPKFYIYNSFEDYGYIVPLKNLFIELVKEQMEETKHLKGDDIETLQKISLDTTKKLNENNEIIHCKLYEIESLKDILNIYLNFFIENNVIINKCKNCGKYFTPSSRTDEVYCNRISPQNPNKTCKEYGVKKTYREDVKTRPVSNEHNRTSQFYRMKIKRCTNEKEKEKLTIKFDKYKVEFKKKKKKYDEKKITESDFVNWIISQKDIV